MQEFRCPVCGGDIEISNDNDGIARCAFCGNIISISEEERQTILGKQKKQNVPIIFESNTIEATSNKKQLSYSAIKNKDNENIKKSKVRMLVFLDLICVMISIAYILFFVSLMGLCVFQKIQPLKLVTWIVLFILTIGSNIVLSKIYKVSRASFVYNFVIKLIFCICFVLIFALLVFLFLLKG